MIRCDGWFAALLLVVLLTGANLARRAWWDAGTGVVVAVGLIVATVRPNADRKD